VIHAADVHQLKKSFTSSKDPAGKKPSTITLTGPSCVYEGQDYEVKASFDEPWEPLGNNELLRWKINDIWSPETAIGKYTYKIMYNQKDLVFKFKAPVNRSEASIGIFNSSGTPSGNLNINVMKCKSPVSPSPPQASFPPPPPDTTPPPPPPPPPDTGASPAQASLPSPPPAGGSGTGSKPKPSPAPETGISKYLTTTNLLIVIGFFILIIIIVVMNREKKPVNTEIPTDYYE
jgi:hypothetical protein